MQAKKFLIVLLSGIVLSGCSDSNECSDSDLNCSEEEVCADGECRDDSSSCKDNETKCDNDKLAVCHNGEWQSESCDDNKVCIDGECRDDSSSCKDNETKCDNDKLAVCHNGEWQSESCDDNKVCIDGECKVQDLTCNPTCSKDETCVDGKCFCGNEICNDNQICNQNKCEEICADKDCDQQNEKCSPSCSGEEVCVDGKCFCGNEVCTDSQTCVNGMCGDVPKICVPACSPDETCIDGSCIKSKQDPCEFIECEGDSVCYSRDTSTVCLCGTEVCNDEQTCKNDKCEWIDPCHDKTCSTGQICVEGNCIDNKITLPTSLDIMLSSTAVLTAQKTVNDPLTWSSDQSTENTIVCLAANNTFVSAKTKISECVQRDDAKHTESVTLLSFARKPTTVHISVKGNDTNTIKSTLNLKPYFDMDNVLNTKTNNKLYKFPTDLIYRNGVCPGYNLGTTNYAAYQEPESAYKSNLGGKDNKYGTTSFTEAETAVFDKDMYVKYIQPKMIKDGDSYYGTRASVVAAARFLILQFPYDVPYIDLGTNSTKQGKSHYIWAYNTEKKLTTLSDVALYGLNLDVNGYNSHVNHKDANKIRTDLVPWGATYGDASKFEFNGLECSGFVTWAFRNGKLAIGDWTTHIFSKNGMCKDEKNNVIRNYQCKNLVNNEGCKQDGWHCAWANQHNYLNSAYDKLNRLKESDFIQLNNRPTSELKTIFDDLKAGDLLWSGNWVKDSNGNKTSLYANGHVAMIIGLKRDANHHVTNIYVGEATTYNGNRLNKWSWSEETGFPTSSWVKNDNRACFVIKMDSVYNYYSETHKPENKNVTTDCPDDQKLTGNCYQYSEMFNPVFNDIITNLTKK